MWLYRVHGMYPQWHTPGTNHLHCLCSETFDGQFIFGLFEPPPTVLTCVKRPTSHASIEMHRKLIMPSSYDSLLCWLVWCLLCHIAAKAKCSGEHFFFSHSLHKHSSCRWTTSYYRTCVMRRQWLLWRTPLIWFIWRWPNQDQYISMTCTPLQTTPAVRIYLLVFCHSFNVVHEQPGLMRVHVSFTWMFYSGNRFFFSVRYVWWASSVELKLLCPHTHIVRVVKACSTHTYTRNHTHIHKQSYPQQQQAQFLPPTERGWFLTSHLLMRAHILELKFPQNRDLVFGLVWLWSDLGKWTWFKQYNDANQPNSYEGYPLSYLYSWYLFFLFMH